MPSFQYENEDQAKAAASFLRAAIFAEVGQPVLLGEIGLDLEMRMVETLKEFTPYSSVEYTHPGLHLRDSTESSPLAVSTGSVGFIVRQTKMITIQGQQVSLAQVLRTGHAAPPNGIRPVYKKALYWPGLAHPVMFSRGGAAAPNDYAERAMVAMVPQVNAVTTTLRNTFEGRIVAVMKGEVP